MGISAHSLPSPMIEVRIETLGDTAPELGVFEVNDPFRTLLRHSLGKGYGALERNSSHLGLQSRGQNFNSSPGDQAMEGHVALVMLSHSTRWAEGRGQPHVEMFSQLFPPSAGAPLPLFIPLQDVWPAPWPFLPGRLLD